MFVRRPGDRVGVVGRFPRSRLFLVRSGRGRGLFRRRFGLRPLVLGGGLGGEIGGCQRRNLVDPRSTR